MMPAPPDLPNCLELTESQRADCYVASNTDRHGFVVYEGYRGCLNSWLAVPGFMLLPTWGLATIYMLILLYMFVGVALASDKFMDSIEVICSATRLAKRKCPVTGQTLQVRVPVWNWVVANVSLMAVGSSAPEILLAVVESVLRLGKSAGELGPSTIVGSAAYNLLMIVAVCTVSLPTGVVKHVRHVRVFVTTGIISLWAYVWMLVVYLWWTPSEVTVAEALLTLLQFALLLLIGWAVDVKIWQKKPTSTSRISNESTDAIVAVDVSAPQQQDSSADALEAGLGSSRTRPSLQLSPSITRRSIGSSGGGAAADRVLQRPPSLNRNSRCSSLTRDGNTLQKTSSLGRSSINSINSVLQDTHTLQKPPSFREGQQQGEQQEQQQKEEEEQQQDLAAAWRQQFVEAIEYDSKAAEDGEEPGGPLGLVTHFVCIFWKLCMATTPPEWWGGGWPCFCGSLLWIIAQVVVIDEVATLLGCVVGLSPLVVGMSLVALGTSLPDTFCSRAAIVKDTHADAAVGNITGSNAANVFLGLGLPWLISSCYYAARGERFCSDSGALAFSVMVYSGVAAIWLLVLFLRRAYAGGELGANSTFAKWGLALVAFLLWGLFLVLTGLVSEGGLDDSWIAVQAGACTSSTT